MNKQPQPSKIGFPSLGIDLDGTIDESAIFFRILTRVWPGNIYIVTYRDDREAAIQKCKNYDISFTDVILVRSFAEKAKVVEEKGISVFFDDQDEVLQHMPFGVTVLKIRNGGNFDFDSLKWLYSDKTGRKV